MARRREHESCRPGKRHQRLAGLTWAGRKEDGLRLKFLNVCLNIFGHLQQGLSRLCIMNPSGKAAALHNACSRFSSLPLTWTWKPTECFGVPGVRAGGADEPHSLPSERAGLWPWIHPQRCLRTSIRHAPQWGQEAADQLLLPADGLSRACA